MYNWYKKSKICIVYLSDVDTSIEDPVERESAFRRSRWFTRGWTLQELLAPTALQFHSNTWSYINNRRHLHSTIAEVTGIRPDCVRDSGRSDLAISVAEKISWASRRQTSRTEDAAYCLMGLLNVNMPLLYGEGTKSFRRLQEEVMKQTSDQTLMAWGLGHSQPRTPRVVSRGDLLADSPACFQGWDRRVGPEEVNQPFFMTNLGLQIQLHISHLSGQVESIGLALLDCGTSYPSQSDRTALEYHKVALPVIYESRSDGTMTGTKVQRAPGSPPFYVPAKSMAETGLAYSIWSVLRVRY
jgi:hypothetical protein